MIEYISPKIDKSFKQQSDQIIKSPEKNIPKYEQFLKKLTFEQLVTFVKYFSFKEKIDIKEFNIGILQFKNNRTKLNDLALKYIVDFKDLNIWNESAIVKVRGVKLGQLYQIQYKNYQHDPFPLALFINTYDKEHENFQAINLHYLLPPFREFLLKTVLQVNQPRIARNDLPIVPMQLINKIFPANNNIAFRNYKWNFIRVIEEIHPNRWLTYLQIDKRKIDI